MTLTVNWNIDGATSIELVADEVAGLIESTTAGEPVQNDTEYVPYTLQ